MAQREETPSAHYSYNPSFGRNILGSFSFKNQSQLTSPRAHLQLCHLATSCQDVQPTRTSRSGTCQHRQTPRVHQTRHLLTQPAFVFLLTSTSTSPFFREFPLLPTTDTTHRHSTHISTILPFFRYQLSSLSCKAHTFRPCALQPWPTRSPGAWCFGRVPRSIRGTPPDA